MKLSIIIINYNTPIMTARAIEQAVLATANISREIILIDNNSTERLSAELLAKYQLRLIQNEENLGFARAVNQGLKIAQGEFILLLNSDMILETSAITRLIKTMLDRPEVAICGPRLVYPNGQLQASFGYFPSLWLEAGFVLGFGKHLAKSLVVYPNQANLKLFNQSHAVDWLTGGAMLIRHSVLAQIGNLDEQFFFGVEDHDLCYRAKQAGFKVWFETKAGAAHYHGFSSGGHGSVLSLQAEMLGRQYFLKKHWPHKHGLRLLSRFGYELKIFKKKLTPGSLIPVRQNLTGQNTLR